MPTIFSHAIFAAAPGKAYAPGPLPFRFWPLTALCAVLPDADVVNFHLGVRYGSMFGHRGFTHSVVFAALIGTTVGALAFRRVPAGFTRASLMLHFFAATLSHPLLDMLTDGGSGVALLAPFSAKRYFFPWRPIAVSPIGMRFFGWRGIDVILSEMIWVWLPALTIVVAAAVVRRIKARDNMR